MQLYAADDRVQLSILLFLISFWDGEVDVCHLRERDDGPLSGCCINKVNGSVWVWWRPGKVLGGPLGGRDDGGIECLQGSFCFEFPVRVFGDVVVDGEEVGQVEAVVDACPDQASSDMLKVFGVLEET